MSVKLNGWDALAQNDYAKNVWNYSQDYLYGNGPGITQQYMNSKNALGISKKNNPFSKGNMQSGGMGWGIIGSAGSQGMNLIDSLATQTKYGKKQTTGGAVLNTVGDAAIMTGNPYAIIGGVLAKGVGTVLNLGFGNTYNEEGISEIKDNIANMRSQANGLALAKNNTDFVNTYNNINLGFDFDKDYVGDEGWWSNGVTKEFNKLTKQNKAGRSYVAHAMATGADSVNKVMTGNVKGNTIIALGGPIDIDPSTAIGYSLYTDKYVKDMQKGSAGMSNLFAGTPDIFGFGGGIHSNGAAFNNGVSYINSGGSHEENPYEGVQMGVDRQGVPNLVEEGEVKWNDYIFSNRLIVPRGKRGNYGKRSRKYASGGQLAKGDKVDVPYEDLVLKPYEGRTFADAAKKIMKRNGAEETNDPITLRGIDAELSVLAGVQEKERQKEQLREMEEAIDNMSPEEFAMLQQQMESQQMAQQQQEEAMRQQQMIPQGMEQMVPADQQVSALGGYLFSPGGPLHTKNSQKPEETAFSNWWDKYIGAAEAEGALDYGKIYKDITGEDLVVDDLVGMSGKVKNALHILYNQDPSKFGEYDYWANNSPEVAAVETAPVSVEEPVVAPEEAAAEIETVPAAETETAAEPESTKKEEEETLGAAEQEALDYYNKRHPKRQKTVKDWKALSDRSREGIISDYRKSIKGRENKAAYDNRLAQQRTAETVAAWQKEQTNSNLTADDIKNLSYEDKLRLAKYMNPDYQEKDLSNLTLNEREAAGKELDEQLVKLSKDKNITIGDISRDFKAPEYHKDWKPVNGDDAWVETNTGYDYQNPLWGGAHDVVAGNTAGKYQPRSWVNDEGKIVINNGDKTYTYDNIKTYELSDEYLKPRYELAKSAASQDEEGQRLWNTYVNGDPDNGYKGLDPNYAESYVPTTVFGQDYANHLKSYDDFKTYIIGTPDKKEGDEGYVKGVYDDLYKAGSGFFDQKAGQMHGMMLPTSVKQRELYQMKSNPGVYLSPEGNWQDYYTDVVTNDGKGTTLHTLDPKGGISFDRMTSLPEGVKQNEDGTYSGIETDNDPFPKASNWPYLLGAGIQAGATLYNALKDPDYSNANALIKAGTEGNFMPISFTPTGHYMAYRPLDTLYQQNILNAKTAATDRSIMNSGVNQGSINAALIANAVAGQLGSGNLSRQEQEYDDALRFKAGEYNKDTDKFNAEGILKADMADQDAFGRAKQAGLEAQRYGYAMRQAVDDAKANAINAGLSGLVNLAQVYGQNKYNQDLLGWGMRHNSWGPGISMKGDKTVAGAAKGGKLRKRRRSVGF